MRIGKAEPENEEVVQELHVLLATIGAVELAELAEVDSRRQAAFVKGTS